MKSFTEGYMVFSLKMSEKEIIETDCIKLTPTNYKLFKTLDEAQEYADKENSFVLDLSSISEKEWETILSD